MKRIIFIIILFTIPLLKGQGQDTNSKFALSLSEAIDYALDFNKSLAGARMEVEKSRHSLWESISQGLPHADGTLDYMTYFNYELEFSFGGSDVSFTPEQYMEAMNQTLSQPQFSSTTPEDLINHQAGNFMDAQLQSMLPPSTILMSDQSTAKFQISQLIFSGQYIVGIQTAKLAQKISEQNLNFTELDVKQAVINAYYLVLITEESLGILEQNLQNLNQILEHTKKMYSAGMAEKTDVDQLRITLNQLENSKNSIFRNLELNYNMLRFQLGLEMNVDLTLTDKLTSLFEELRPKDALLNQFHIESNPTYQIMKTQEDINKKLVDLEQWNYAPTIAGFYAYNAKILTTGFDMNPNHMAGLSLSLPIFSSGMRKAKVNQAKIDYRLAQNNRSILEDQLELQYKQYRYNLQNAIENYETQKENVVVARSVYDSYRLKFEQGMASSLELTQANSNYLEAEGNYISAVMEVLNAKLQLDKLQNNLE
ncbi:MAG: TolC family protein [Bacteroidales bacterium]|nr:TolC family protein [Bacteroidales bacterium]MBN2699145.1 TolC family protein [Bacteroidales bacterium]